MTAPISLPRATTPAAVRIGTQPHTKAPARKRERQPVSLRAEILVGLAVMATAALLLAMISAMVFDEFVARHDGAPYLAALVILDVVVFVIFGASRLRHLVIEPLDKVVATTEAIAGGDLTRRVPMGSSLELDRLAAGVNRMTSRLLEEQALSARLDKVASVGRLATNVAHEVGNPLAAINGYLHLLRTHTAATSEMRDMLGGIEHESARIDRIVRGMLDYARPRQKTVTSIDVNRSVSRVVQLLRDQGGLRDIHLRMHLDSTVPPLAGDPHDLDQVFVNLILNAVDVLNGKGDVAVVTQRAAFSSLSGGAARRASDSSAVHNGRDPNPRVKAWLATVGELEEVLKIVVADSGPGVLLSESERIFDPFYTTKEPGKGTGLGLAIVSRIVESLGGAIWVRTAREGGAAFVMLFAIRPDDVGRDSRGA